MHIIMHNYYKFIGGEKKIRTDAVYITQLPDDVTEAKLGEYFGSIGVIKVCAATSLNRTVYVPIISV